MFLSSKFLRPCFHLGFREKLLRFLRSFPFKVSLVNLNKGSVDWEMGHICYRNDLKNSTVWCRVRVHINSVASFSLLSLFIRFEFIVANFFSFTSVFTRIIRICLLHVKPKFAKDLNNFGTC